MLYELRMLRMFTIDFAIFSLDITVRESIMKAYYLLVGLWAKESKGISDAYQILCDLTDRLPGYGGAVNQASGHVAHSVGEAFGRWTEIPEHGILVLATRVFLNTYETHRNV